MRKFVYQNFTTDDLLKLFPPDLPFDLQTLLLSCFHKNGHRWKHQISTEQVRTNVPSAAMSKSLWPRQDGGINISGVPACFKSDIPLSDNLENLPCLKSMTWTMENRGSSPADKVAVISLKLHDYSKSPLGETEVKFQLTRDTFEAMLRSMTYIRDQLSAVGTSSGPANKKQKQ